MTTDHPNRLRVLDAKPETRPEPTWPRPFRDDKPTPDPCPVTRAELVELSVTIKRAHRMIEAALDRLCAS